MNTISQQTIFVPFFGMVLLGFGVWALVFLRRRTWQALDLSFIGTAGTIALTLLLALPATAREIEGVEFSDRLQPQGEVLELHGLGLLRYRWVFKGYVAALYLPPGTAAERALEDVAKRLELEYFWSIAGPDFGDAAEQLLAKSLSARELDALRERLTRLHAAYQDVKPGDRYALDYLPGKGTTLSKNGDALATIPGADFAKAYFGIWLGKQPLDESLKQQLLEGL